MYAFLFALALPAGSLAGVPPSAPGSVVVEGGALSIDVSPDGRMAALVFRRSGQKVPGRVEIRTVDTALRVLVDPRLAPLWPELLAWTGSDLTRLRDAELAQARAVVADGRTMRADTTAASSVRPKVRAVLLLSDALRRAGQHAEAERIVAAARGEAPAEDDWGEAEWTMTSLRLANLRQERGDTGGALALLDASAAPLGDSPYAMNLRVNRAVYLLEVDRNAEALAEIEAAMAAFGIAADGKIGQGGEKVPGSERQFAWIRGCALHKLGRRAEAAAIAAALTPAVEPSDQWLVIQPSAALRLRYVRCTRDVDLAAQIYAEEIASAPFGGNAAIDLQSARRSPRIDPAFQAAIRRHPRLAPLLATRMRELPPLLVPALNEWRSGN